jgi:predicted RNase H-like nuclease (RuvC/YqgF family)
MLGIDKLEKEKQSLQKKVRNAHSEIQDLSDGRTTIKTLFKSQSAKQNKLTDLHTFVTRNQVIISTYKNVIDSLTIFMAMKEIPIFKIWKTSNYYRCLTTFCTQVNV